MMTSGITDAARDELDSALSKEISAVKDWPAYDLSTNTKFEPAAKKK